MFVAVCDACREERQKVRELVEAYGRRRGQEISVEEYGSPDEILEELQRKKQKTMFPFVEGSMELELQKIIYIETDRHKNIFHTEDADYRLYKKLDEIEAELIPYGFLRVHKSFLVNMRYVEKISSYLLRLTTGKEISVPKSRYAHVKSEYAAYRGA